MFYEIVQLTSERFVLGPLDQLDVLYAVLRQSRRLCQGTHGEIDSGWVERQRAFEAGCHARGDDSVETPRDSISILNFSLAFRFDENIML